MFQLGGWVSLCTLNQISECMEHLRAAGWEQRSEIFAQTPASCRSFHQGKGAEFPLLCLAGEVKGKRRVKGPHSAADQMFDTSAAKQVRHHCFKKKWDLPRVSLNSHGGESVAGPLIAGQALLRCRAFDSRAVLAG